MNEPTVQVPVSLIERLELTADVAGQRDPDAARDAHALLSQPTPTAEPCKRCGHFVGEHIEGGCLVCDCQALEDRTAWDAAVQAKRAEQRAKGVHR